MKEAFFAIISVLLGLALTFGGYRLARVIIPLWGFFAGFTLGASGTSDALNSTFIGTTLGIVVGFFVGLLFALLAYFFFSLAIILFTASLGYWLGTSIVLFFGFNKGFLSATVGIILGIVFGLVALFGNFTKYYLMIVTAFGGAVVAFGGVLLLFNKIDLDAFNYAAASQAVSGSWFLALAALAVGVVGLVFQLRTNQDYQLEEWGALSAPTAPKKVSSTVEDKES